jgi:signal transduction histidine kinase
VITHASSNDAEPVVIESEFSRRDAAPAKSTGGGIRGIFRDSIALRVSLAVFGGLVLTHLVGFLLISGERLHLLPAMDASPLVGLVDQTLQRAIAADPVEQEIAGASGVTAVFAEEFRPVGDVIDPPPIHALRMHLMESANARYDLVLIEAPSPVPDPGFFRVWLRLPWEREAARRWLVMSVPAELLRSPDIWRLILWWSLSLICVCPLSLFVARRLTAPIRRFSAAAERLGLDMSALPIPEQGPAELKSAAAAMNAMQRRIKRFVDDRTQMLAAISHDLRTPISRLRLRTGNLPEDSDKRLMIADLARMDQMIGATLDFARDASAAEARRRIDLASLVESACQDLSDLGRKAIYRGPDYLEFTCRPVAVGRALHNILENAAEYAGDAEASIIDRGDAVEIAVRDHGPGIPKNQLERVFEPFHRLDAARSSSHLGAGLGLSIARNVARGHGGDVTLMNHPDGGLLVTLRLPHLATEVGTSRHR